jgi:transcriptional regulator with GAF, ATPase, and Fis domain
MKYVEDSEEKTELRRELMPVETVGFELTVIRGPDKGLVLSVDTSQPFRALIGQSPACLLRITDRLVSRRHAAVEVRGQELRIVDLNSTNGTTVNGLSVYEAGLWGGELIQVGETEIEVRRIGAANLNAISASEADSFGIYIGSSLEMRKLYPLCKKIAASSVPVVIEGETGTGKEVLAEAIHQQGPRANKSFVVFDCTAVPPSLVESALFGHVRGSFTGATGNHTGVFEQANGGTLLIDEIGDLDTSLQPKLLRALQRGEVQRVGGEKWIKVDVRVLSATRRDLDREVQAGRFRDDLFFRLAVARIELPPLRRREGDIAMLTSFFWKQMGGEGEPPASMLQRFLDYSWPGNVRELQNAVARYIALGEFAHPPGTNRTILKAGEEKDPIQRILDLGLPLAQSRSMLVEQFERQYIENILAQNNGSINRAASASGVALRYFQLLKARYRSNNASNIENSEVEL